MNKQRNKDPRSPPQDPTLRELRGNAIQLQAPVTKSNVQQYNQDQEQYNANFNFQSEMQDSSHTNKNLQRSSYNLSEGQNDIMGIIAQDLKAQQYHSGLIAPANFYQNPFTSYLKSIGATVGQVQQFNDKLDHAALAKELQKADKLSQNADSRNENRKKAAVSLQPLTQRNQSSSQFVESSLNRIQIKDKLQRNGNKTIDRLSQQKHQTQSEFEILSKNLDANEIRALRVANPLHQAFNTHLSKVITSVTRRQRGELDQDNEMLALEENKFGNQQVTRSEPDGLRNQDQSLELFKGQSEIVNYVQNTPTRVRQEARRELALLNDKQPNNQKHFTLFKPQINDNFVPQQRVVDQVTSLLNRVNKNKDQVFIPLEIEVSKNMGGIGFRDAKNPNEIKEGQMVFTKAGFISIPQNKNQPTEVISKETYIQEGVQQMVLNQVPFFRKFLALKTFKLWKNTMQRNLYIRNRQKLAKNFIFSKPIFSQKYKQIVQNINEVRQLKLLDTKQGVQYGKHQTYMFDVQCALFQKHTKEDIALGLTAIRKMLEEIKDFIVEDDKQFVEFCKENQVLRMIKEKPNAQEIVLFTKSRNAQESENKERQLMTLRQNQYNGLVQLVSRLLFQNLSELLIENKSDFTQLFTAQRSTTQFEISLTLDKFGKLTTTPTASEHRDLFKRVFSQMEETVFKNSFLQNYFQDLVQMFFWEDKWSNPPGTLLMRRQLTEIEQHVMSHPKYIRFDSQIDEQLTTDLQRVTQQLAIYAEVEEVYDFTHDWNEKRNRIRDQPYGQTGSSVSQEIEFYQTTWIKLDQLNIIIEKIPILNTKLGTILLETASLKKVLLEMPRQIVESIRTNVTQTIESETKILKDELSQTSDTLDKIPTTLNIYVDQVNTLKYLKEKSEEFKNKFNTILTLQKQCKQDNIRIGAKLVSNIEEVAQLYGNLPKLIQKAQDGLKHNKVQIEASMFRSSDGLSLKIKAFEKKYVETYLQDRTRLERCKETLDELLRRSQAIVEMKSKVVLYKEFLKILYEDDADAEAKLQRKKLSCSEDCDFIEAIHKNTIKMWKVFLYWTKKRQICFTTPFLEFDLKIILKAISKVSKFLNDQAKQSEVVAYKSQPITRAVNTQVKDTQVIVEFVKEMNKDTLKRRHWSQIFQLLKASHLKNSTTFTIIDLREYNIQNQAAEVRAIIEHANTESKYENVFISIRNEWEESNLRIIPFKEQVNDYIIANSELMSDAIEDNLSTLDTIARSPYAAHVIKEIEELMQKLKSMLEHLLLWTQAQKYWLTLDPIYNSGLFKNFFEQHTQDFLDTRSQFRRIMWSSYRRPKTSYNLMIADRLPVFEHLIHFYAMIQKQVNLFLESKRLLFSRFYFLNDSQFLDLMRLANSNQDYSVYINILFSGVQKLFVTRLLDEQKLQSLAHNYENEQVNDQDNLFDNDIETQLENFIVQGRKRQQVINSDVIEEISDTLSDQLPLRDLQERQYNYTQLDTILLKPIQEIRKPVTAQTNRNHQFVDTHFGDVNGQSLLSDSDNEDSKRGTDFDAEIDSVLNQKQKSKAATETDQLMIYKDLVNQRQGIFDDSDNILNKQTHDYIALGFIGQNKELLLFDQHVSMSQPLEVWFSEIELAMQDSLRKQMIASIENFLVDPLEEWILDYPQQIAISTLHLILSQEVHDLLTSKDYDTQLQRNSDNDGSKESPMPKSNVLTKYQEVALQIGGIRNNADEEDGEPKGIKDKKDVSKQQIVIRKRATLEPDFDIEEVQLQFIDDCFGEQANIEEALDRAVQQVKNEDRLQSLQSKKNPLNVRKPDYKEQILAVLQSKGLNCLFIRLQFWINKMMTLLYLPKQKYGDTLTRVTQLPGVQKMRIKSMVLFLKHQQEQVQQLIQLKVTNVNDFEWQSKLRLTWTGEAQAVCGGWSLNIGYEYLGTTQRLLLTPLTTRYFVFMASALRDKQSAMLQCSPYETTSAEIVQEFAALCQLPFKSHQCTQNNNLSTLTQLLNGGAMANTWVFFEHFNNLPIEHLQIIVKEIQLLHEQFIVSGFQRNLMKERIAKQQGVELNQISTDQLPKQNFMVTLGIFASTSFKLLQSNLSGSRKLFEDQVKASFRIIALAKPNLESIIKNILFVEDFTEYRQSAALYTAFIKKFLVKKSHSLSESIKSGQNQEDSFEIAGFRQIIKHAVLLRNQEFDSYYTKQLEKRSQQSTLLKEKRLIYVVQNKQNQMWEIRRKLRDHWHQERIQQSNSLALIQNEKFRIEIDSLREATRQVYIQKYLNEFQIQEMYYQTKNGQRYNIDIKSLEEQLQSLINKVFNEVVADKNAIDKQIDKQNSIRAKMEREDQEQIQKPVGDVVQLSDQARLANARVKTKLIRKDSLVDYAPKIGYVPASDSQSIKHKQQADLFYNLNRQSSENQFQLLLQQGLKTVANEFNIDLNREQLYNCVGVVESMKRSKGVVICGPICSGKTQLIKLVTIAYKKIFNVNLRTSYLSPNTFTNEDLFGPVLAFDQGSVYQLDQPLQAQSIFQIILQNYSRERNLSTQAEQTRLIQAIYIDQADLNQDFVDSFKSFLKLTNLRERDYLDESEFLLDFSTDAKQVQTGLVQNVPVRFPNGNITLFPNDLYLFFECQSLKDASPSFLSQVSIVNTQADDVRYEHIFQLKLKQLLLKHYAGLKQHKVDINHLEECCNEFVTPFMKQLNKNTQINSWMLWDLKALTNQLFGQIDAQLYYLIGQAEYQKIIDDDSYPLEEMQRDALWNLVLSSTIWSLGAVLNKELRQIFDDLFGAHKQKFNITFAAKNRYKLFDIFYDIQKLSWSVFTEKLEYKLKSYFEPSLQALLLPTVDISQAFYLLDIQTTYMKQDKELNKSFRLIGPNSSSKSVILNTFMSKIQQQSVAISVPMTAYLTLDLFKQKVEQNYRKKRENCLVPKDPSKQILLIIDDVHLQYNLKFQLLEFIRSWCFNRGYFSVDKQGFKKIADFGCILAENSNFKSNTNKKERFLYHTTTLYCESISIDSYKLFIQSWLTSNQWPVSQLVTKYYLLISNSLMMLFDKMNNSELLINSFSYSSLTSFQYVAKFCANLVLNTAITDSKVDVYGLGAEANSRREEEALADLFCYEVMRTFGDRLMRPSAKQFFMEKLSYICQKEFSCNENYNAAYIEQLVLGDYHKKEEQATHQYSSIMTTSQRVDALQLIKQKCKKLSGNTFLPLLLDSPQGLADCYRISRILYKSQQHLILMGQSGVSKLEMIQLAAITNNVPLFEIDTPAYGEPLHFAYNFKQVLLSIAKINRSSYVVINDQVAKDPIYYDFLYNFIQQLSRHESFVMFDDQFFIDLAAIEAQHIKKLKKVTVPDEFTLFKYGIQKLQKNVHFVLIMSDQMTYKEVIQMFPQLEYLCEVMYMEDLTQQDYLQMTNSFLERSSVGNEFLGEEMTYSRSLVEVRNRVKQLLLKNFYSTKMLKYTVREEYAVHGASEYIFNDADKLQNNIYKDSKGYQVQDEDLQSILLSMGLEVQVLNKHRYGMFIEVCKFIYELLQMHLQSRKSYYETFLSKSRQFHKYFSSVKESKKGLHEDQNTHSFRVAMATDKIKEIKLQLQEKQMNIKKKSQEIVELQEELNTVQDEIETVILEKNWKLECTINELKQISNHEFHSVVFKVNYLDETDIHVLKLINTIILQKIDPVFNKNEAAAIFMHPDELINVLNDRRQHQFSRPIFDQLNEFAQNRSALEFSEKHLMSKLYSYLIELYRKLNIKNTMSVTFHRIKEIRDQIDSNVFSINYAKQSIESKNQELKMQQSKLHDLEMAGNKLSRKIEEAELSYMRTDQIFKNIETYSNKIEYKLRSITSRTQTLQGDSILLGCSVVYLGMFAPELREQFRAQLFEYLSKVRNIQCNKMWIETSQTQSANPNKSMFIQVLKDIGLRDQISKNNMPDVLSYHQFGEALFSMLFAPSCPVVCDPTGVMQEFVQKNLFANMEPQVISGTDLLANEKLQQNLAQNKPSIVLDVNCHNSRQSGLTLPHNLLRTLSNTLYNGVDFDSKRQAQMKKIGSVGSYLSHGTGQNKRIPILSAALEHISLYQACIFQPRFEFQLNQDYLQNATFICASPSLVVESRSKLEENQGMVRLKELITERILPQSYNFSETKQTLQSLNKKIIQFERNYENAFLIATGETFKKVGEYSELRSSVEDVINTRQLKEEYLMKYRAALKKVRLVTEASDVIFQMYLVLKLVGKQTNSVTYSWSQFTKIIDSILDKLIQNLKIKALQQRNQGEEEAQEMGDVEIEIDNTFFKKKFVPLVHQALVCSIDSNHVPLYNFFLSLRLAHTYKAINALEHQFILKQLVDLKNYKQWRNSDHQFVKINDTVDKSRHQNLRRELLRLYPDLARQIFDQIEKNLGNAFQYLDCSIFIQKELKEKFNLTQVQQLTFGFLCPDTEFKSKMTLFMYTQNMATFDFTEEITSLGEFLACGDFLSPILLRTQPSINPLNLITTLAHQQGRSLIVLRTDPSYHATKILSQVFNIQLTDRINSHLQDYSTIRQENASSFDPQQLAIDLDDNENMGKQHWLAIKQRNVNLDEGKIFFQEGDNQHPKGQQSPHIQQIIEAANQGSWVVLCPIQFPHFFPKLLEKLEHMKQADQINSNFRIIIDLQNYNQNEIPDSFAFNDSCTFYLTQSNYDRVTTLNDIWSKILNPVLLERLTDTENGNKNLKKIEYNGDERPSEAQTHFMQVFSSESQDQHASLLFNKFIEKSTVEFTNKLKQQRVQSLKRLQEEKSAQLQVELERQRQLETIQESRAVEALSNRDSSLSLDEEQLQAKEDAEIARLNQQVVALQLASRIAEIEETGGNRLNEGNNSKMAGDQLRAALNTSPNLDK